MDIFPISYFGSIAYYQALCSNPHSTLDVGEHFIKQTIRTRMEILGPNGKQTLTIPVQRPFGNKTAMKEVRIVEDGWRKLHIRSLKTAYASSPFYDYYEKEIIELIENEELSLIQFLAKIHLRIIEWLGLPLELNWSMQFVQAKEGDRDFRKTTFDSEGEFNIQPYTQVFAEKKDYVNNLSILDLIFNEGPMARKWIIQ